MFRRAAFLLCLLLVAASSFAWYSETNPDHVPSLRFDYDKYDIDGDKTIDKVDFSQSEWEQRFGAAIRLPVFDEFSVELRGGNVQKRIGPNGFSMGGASYGASAIFYLDYSRKNEVRWTPIARHPGYEISSDGEIRKIQGTGDEQPVNVVPLPEESHSPQRLSTHSTDSLLSPAAKRIKPAVLLHTYSLNPTQRKTRVRFAGLGFFWR